MSAPSAWRTRPFAWGDLVIYAVLTVVVAVVCMAVYIPKASAMQSVVVYYQNSEIYRYEWQTRKGYATACEGVSVWQDGDQVVIQSALGRNVLTFADSEVRFTEADCRTQECMRTFSPLRKGGDVLVCLPHALRVVAYGDVGNEVIV